MQATGSKIYAVRIDVPNLPTGSFTLRQTPIAIPEPSSLAIAGLAALGLVGSLRRQEK